MDQGLLRRSGRAAPVTEWPMPTRVRLAVVAGPRGWLLSAIPPPRRRRASATRRRAGATARSARALDENAGSAAAGASGRAAAGTGSSRATRASCGASHQRLHRQRAVPGASLAEAAYRRFGRVGRPRAGDAATTLAGARVPDEPAAKRARRHRPSSKADAVERAPVTPRPPARDGASAPRRGRGASAELAACPAAGVSARRLAPCRRPPRDRDAAAPGARC